MPQNNMPKGPTTESTDPYRWIIFGIMVSVYFFVYFHRVSTSVLAPDLLVAFQTNATALGLMSSTYFYLYALSLPLAGHLADRLGPRRVVGFWCFISAGGCFLFALAPTIGWAAAGRALIGFGTAGVYIPAIKAFSQWFPKRDFATMNGLLLSAGNLGAIVATTPLAWVATRWAWRSCFLAIGAITAGLAILTLGWLRDHPGSAEDVITSPIFDNTHVYSTKREALQVLRSAWFWILATITFWGFGSILTFQSLWITPFLMSTLDLNRMHASELNMLFPIGYIFGAPLSGRLADRVLRNKVHLLLGLLTVEILIWIGLTFGGEALGTKAMVPLLFVMGGGIGGMVTTVSAIVREISPDYIFGLISGLLNPFAFFGAAVLQVLTGAILDHVGRVGDIYPPEAFRAALLVCLLIITGCLALLWFFRSQMTKKY